MRKINRFLTVMAVSVASFSTQAAILNSSNGHYYDLVTFADIGERLDWFGAKSFAENSSFNGKLGHLATLTSAAEDDFVWNRLGAEGYFLGAFDNSTLGQNGTWSHNSWQWVTGEAFSYSNWLLGEPNHWQDGSGLTPNNEDYLVYGWQDRGAGVLRWNDTNVDSSYIDDQGNKKYTARGFVIEYEAAVSNVPPATVPVPGAFWLFSSVLAVFGLHKKKELFANS